MLPAVVSYNEFEAAVRRIQRVAVRNVGEGAIRAISDALVITSLLDYDTLSPADFSSRLERSVGVSLTSAELAAIVASTDADGTARVGVGDVLAALRGGLRPVRRVLVDRVPLELSLRANGTYDRSELLAHHNPHQDPRVLEGTTTAERVSEGLCATFPRDVLPQQVLEYFAGLSVEVDDDDAFEALLRACWLEKGGQGGNPLLRSIRRATTNGATGAAPSVDVPIRPPPPPLPKGSCTWAARTKQPTSPWPTTWTYATPPETGATLGSTSSPMSFRTVQHIAEKESVVAAAERRDAALRMIESHRAALRQDPLAYRLVGRAVRRPDPTRSGTVAEADFISALWQCRLYTDDPTGGNRDMLALFRTPDGSIDYMRYLYMLVPPMRASRRVALERLWATFPRDSHNRVDVMALQQRFEAASGQELNDFLSAWDRSYTAPDGRVSLQELEEYYTALSERIELDAEFRRMLKLQWTSAA